jgi:hypothetical protein
MLDRTHTKFTPLCSAEPNLSDHINKFDVSSKMMRRPLLACWTTVAGDRHNTSYRRYQCLTSSNQKCDRRHRLKYITLGDDELFAITLWLTYLQIFNISSYKKCHKQSYLLLTPIDSFVRLESRFHNIANSKTSLWYFLKYRPDSLYTKVSCISQCWTVRIRN